MKICNSMIGPQVNKTAYIYNLIIKSKNGMTDKQKTTVTSE